MDKNKGMMIIIIIMLTIIIAGLVGGAVFLVNALNSDSEPPPQPQHMAPGYITEADILRFALPRTIATNLLPGPAGRNDLVRVGVAIGINNTDEELGAEFYQTLRGSEDAIFDAINGILRRTTADNLRREGGDDQLRETIMVALQDLFATHMIVRVYLTEIVIQTT